MFFALISPSMKDKVQNNIYTVVLGQNQVLSKIIIRMKARSFKLINRLGLHKIGQKKKLNKLEKMMEKCRDMWNKFKYQRMLNNKGGMFDSSSNLISDIVCKLTTEFSSPEETII